MKTLANFLSASARMRPITSKTFLADTQNGAVSVEGCITAKTSFTRLRAQGKRCEQLDVVRGIAMILVSDAKRATS